MKLRLPTTSKVKKIEKQKKKEKAKEENNGAEAKGKITVFEKVNKAYIKNELVKTTGRLVPLRALNYGYIRTCRAVGINTVDGYIEVSEDWIEVLAIMLGTLRSRFEDEKIFYDRLASRGILTQHFSLDTKYGKLSTSEAKYTTYHIDSLGRYIEMVYSEETVYKTLILLALELQLPLKETYIQLQSYSYSRDEIGDMLDNEYTDYEEVTPSKLYKRLSETSQTIQLSELESKSGEKEVFKSHRVDLLGFEICTWIYDNYGYSKLMDTMNDIIDIHTDKETGEYKELTTGLHLGEYSGYGCSQIRNSNIYMYSSGELKDSCKLIQDICRVNSEIKKGLHIYFKKQPSETERTNWEVDNKFLDR